MAIDLQKRKKLLLILAISCVGILIADRLVITPYFRSFSARSEKIRELKAELERGQLLLSRANSIRGEWLLMEKGSLTTDRTAAEGIVFDRLNKWRRESDVTFTAINPNWLQGDQIHTIYEVRITAVGSLEQVARFLYTIETDPIAVRVEEAQISSEDERGQKLRLTVRLSFLQLKSKQQEPSQREQSNETGTKA